MRRLIECGAFGLVIAGAWLAAAWAAGASAGMTWRAWIALAVALVVSYGGLVELVSRAAVRSERGRE